MRTYKALRRCTRKFKRHVGKGSICGQFVCMDLWKGQGIKTKLWIPRLRAEGGPQSGYQVQLGGRGRTPT